MQNEWISVKDSLPEYGERVFVTNGYETHEAMMTKDQRWRTYLFLWADGITHWMPLPEPPKGE